MSKCEFFESQLKYLGHMVSGQGIFLMKQKVQVIIDLVPTTNITEAQNMIIWSAITENSFLSSVLWFNYSL